jgi:hypothetical protein
LALVVRYANHPRISFFITGILDIANTERNDVAVALKKIMSVSKGEWPMLRKRGLNTNKKTG